MLDARSPALVLAPMEGVTDAPMRALQGRSGAFTYAVSEFLRVSNEPIPRKVFRRDVPELETGGRTATGMRVQVQLLGGDPDRMARSASTACAAGADAVDINFGCPAPIVNRHDGGAALLRHPCRIREIVAAVRAAVPDHIPVSAKLRLGWDSIQAIHLNAEMAAEGGASWLTIHARTKEQGYQPPVYWKPIGEVRRALGLPVIANGDIWTLDDFLRCREETGCIHFMVGRGALADPTLPARIASEMGLMPRAAEGPTNWPELLGAFAELYAEFYKNGEAKTLARLKQWLRLASKFGDFPHFDRIKQATTVGELLAGAR